jgi:hypothetical protein
MGINLNIHDGKPSIFVKSDNDFSVDDSTIGTIKVTIPKDTYMYHTSGYTYGFNYCAFLQVKITHEDGTVEYIPDIASDTAKDFIETLTTQSASSSYNVLSDFKSRFAPYVFLFRVGTSTASSWSSYPKLTADRKITFTYTPVSSSDSANWELSIVGVTVNTATWTNAGGSLANSLRYSTYKWIMDDRNHDSDVYEKNFTYGPYTNYTGYIPGGGGNACPCDEHKSKLSSGSLWSSISKGSVSITDNFNNTVKVSGTNGTKGTSNNLTAGTLTVKLSDGTELTLTSTVDALAGTTSGDKFEYIYKLPSSIATATTAVTVKAELTNTGTYGSSKKASASKSVKHYTNPVAPNQMWITTGKTEYYKDTVGSGGVHVPHPNLKSSLDNTVPGVTNPSQFQKNYAIKPRLKDILMWKWKGFSNGTNAPVAGFRIYTYKGAAHDGGATTPDNSATIPLNDESKYMAYVLKITNSDATGESNAIKDITHADIVATGTTSRKRYYDIEYNDVSKKLGYAQFGYYPNSLTFVDGKALTGYSDSVTDHSGSLCTCNVYTYAYWGDGSQHFSSNYLEGQCYVYNGAVVWVCAPKSSSDPTLVWKEGTVYVHNGTTWKEAEGVYVHNGSSWKEST